MYKTTNLVKECSGRIAHFQITLHRSQTKPFKLRLGAHFLYICCIFEHLIGLDSMLLSAMERNSEMSY